MKRTNTKDVTTAVRNYLLESNEDEFNSMEEIAERFINEYSWRIARAGDLNACMEWLKGLAINCEFTYYGIAEKLAEWLDDTHENQMKWIEQNGDDKYWYLLAREIIRVIR